MYRKYTGAQQVPIKICYHKEEKRLDITISKRSIYVPSESVRRARNKVKGNTVFQLQDLYSAAEWSGLPKDEMAALEKGFYNYVLLRCSDIRPTKGISKNGQIHYITI